MRHRQVFSAGKITVGYGVPAVRFLISSNQFSTPWSRPRTARRTVDFSGRRVGRFSDAVASAIGLTFELVHSVLINPGKSRMSTRSGDRGHERPPRYSGQQQSTHQLATDQEIQKWISRQHGFVPESAWLLHCKELFGLVAPGTAAKENPCPAEKIATIKQAFRRFGIL